MSKPVAIAQSASKYAIRPWYLLLKKAWKIVWVAQSWLTSPSSRSQKSDNCQSCTLFADVGMGLGCMILWWDWTWRLEEQQSIRTSLTYCHPDWTCYRTYSLDLQSCTRHTKAMMLPLDISWQSMQCHWPDFVMQPCLSQLLEIRHRLLSCIKYTTLCRRCHMRERERAINPAI